MLIECGIYLCIAIGCILLRDDGIWISRTSTQDATGRPVLFLDRDGVIVEDIGYLSRPRDVKLLPGISQLISVAKEKLCWQVAIVTNQSGVGRGYFSWEDFLDVQNRILDELRSLNKLHCGGVDITIACPFHEDAFFPHDVKNHFCRKPAPGMLREVETLLRVNLNLSWIVGDKMSDMFAGNAAGLKGGFLLNGQFRHGPSTSAGKPNCCHSRKFCGFHSFKNISTIS